MIREFRKFQRWYKRRCKRPNGFPSQQIEVLSRQCALDLYALTPRRGHERSPALEAKAMEGLVAQLATLLSDLPR